MDITSKTLKLNKKGDVLYFSFPDFDNLNLVKHGFSTRLGGVSTGMYKSMNLSFNQGDKEEDVLENYKRFSNALDIKLEDIVLTHQTHSANIRIVSEKDKGKGILTPRDYDDIDGLITNIKNIALATIHADCVPLFFIDPKLKIIGLAHSGWKGTVNKIGENMISVFKENYGSRPQDILVGIGPSIGPCCFEVGVDVKEEFEQMTPSISECIRPVGEKYHIDLWQVNKKILMNVGVLEENIKTTDVCTMCNKEVLFSHRGSLGKRGSLLAILELC
ncbi:MAG: peptidoglycan editing factor PgeF [Clostridiaceae bacterium]